MIVRIISICLLLVTSLWYCLEIRFHMFYYFIWIYSIYIKQNYTKYNKRRYYYSLIKSFYIIANFSIQHSFSGFVFRTSMFFPTIFSKIEYDCILFDSAKNSKYIQKERHKFTQYGSDKNNKLLLHNIWYIDFIRKRITFFQFLKV